MSADRTDYFFPAPGGLGVRVRVTPKAGRNRIEGVRTDAEGNRVLKVTVTAAPEGGKANAALIKLLARAWRVPKTSLSIGAGAGGRRKTVFVAGDPAALAARLDQGLGNDHD